MENSELFQMILLKLLNSKIYSKIIQLIVKTHYFQFSINYLLYHLFFDNSSIRTIGLRAFSITSSERVISGFSFSIQR